MTPLVTILATLLAVALLGAEPVGAAPSAPPAPQGARATATHVAAARAAALRPKIVWRPIAFGAKRKREMAGYSKRHYGHRIWRLSHPRAIVEHYTDGGTFAGAWATMASNARNLGELPGVCAHFVVDTDGTIYQVVPLRIRCRHTIGLNQTAIGIEHVGTSDAQILHNAAEMRASLRLTLWLVAKFHIQVRNVIGHAEALTSPFHHERYPSWRCFVHADWQHRDMITYRGLLRARARAAHVPIGPGPVWVHPHC